MVNDIRILIFSLSVSDMSRVNTYSSEKILVLGTGTCSLLGLLFLSQFPTGMHMNDLYLYIKIYPHLELALPRGGEK